MEASSRFTMPNERKREFTNDLTMVIIRIDAQQVEESIETVNLTGSKR
jgi:hypothetical protein